MLDMGVSQNDTAILHVRLKGKYIVFLVFQAAFASSLCFIVHCLLAPLLVEVSKKISQHKYEQCKGVTQNSCCLFNKEVIDRATTSSYLS